MGGARLYRSQTARVNAPVRPLIASGPPIPPPSIRCRPGAGPIPNRARFVAVSGPMSAYCATVTSSTGTYLDFSDLGFNCVVPWGKYKGGALVLWQLKMIVELEPGDAFFFMGSLIAHNVGEIEGVRNSIDLFCHKNVLSWKDKCDKERRGKKLK